MPHDPPIIQESQSPRDEGLRCPTCEYNLTGLEVDICPECGDAFDREQLLAELAGEPSPIPIWSQRLTVPAYRAFIMTVIEIWVHPIRFAERFPANPDRSETITFSRWCLGISVGILFLQMAVLSGGSPRDLIQAALTLTGLVLGVLATEWTIAMLVFAPPLKITKVGTPAPWSQQSLSLARMTRVYLLMSTMGVSFCLAGLLILPAPNDVAAISAYVLAAIAVTWWICLSLIARTYRKNSINFFLGIFLIPICVIVCGGLAAVLVGLSGLLFFRL